MSPARIGVIGAGYWASYQYLPFYRDHPEVELVGAVRKDEAGLDAFRRGVRARGARRARSDELLAAGVDGVVVSSPHDLHREHAVAALEAGAHVLVEKPMTLTLADAEAIGEAARALRAATVAVAHGWNWSRLTDWAKEDVGGRAPRAYHVRHGVHVELPHGSLLRADPGTASLDVGGFPVEAETATWAKADAGGGYLFGQLTHLLALGLWLVPNEPRGRVRAREPARERRRPRHPGLAGLAGGVIGSFSGQGHEPWGRRHACDLRIAGEDGVLMLDFDRVQAQVLLEGDKERAEWLTLEPDPPAVEDDAEYTCDGPAQFLVDACLGREAVNRAPLDVGIRTVAVMEAAWRSAHTGQPVRVADLATA